MRWNASPQYGYVLAAYLALIPDAFADVSGKVFRDFNGNGSFDSNTSFNEVGMLGVTVKAFDTTGAQVGASTASAADGSYTLTGLTVGADYRVEFSWAETWLKPGVAGGSSVQFVKDGATRVDLAVSDPNEYAHTDNPYLVIPQYINGNAGSTGISDRPSVFVIPFNAQSSDHLTQTPQPIIKASIGQTGATWGGAYQRSHKTFYTSAVIRRFAGLGPLGIGGIYKVDMSNPTTASTGSLNYVDVKNIGIPVGDDPRDGSACNSLATSIDQPSHDIAAAQQVGTVGVGGISMDNDHNRLWLVNMADHKLYGIQNVNPATTPTAADVLGGYSIELPSGVACQSGVLRPWAVKYYQDKVYVGASCDASSAYPSTEELAGYVLRFDPTNTAAGFTVEHSFRFNTPRANYGPDTNSFWYGWQSSYLTSSPLLTSIEFDLDGSLMVGVLDRGAIMSGANNYNSLDCADTSLSDMTGAGDVLRFCKSGNTYVDSGAAACTTTIPDAVKTHDEYYWGDYGPVKDQKIAFNETTQGGLTFLPGSGQLVSNGFDPTGFHQGGLYWFNNQTGGDDNRYFIYTTQTGLSHPPETMGKVAGLGDLELVLDPAPTEIGNRVWLDSDKDGIQDAGEIGIDGVDVVLTCGANTATTTTANGGVYLFSSANNASFMKANDVCSISIAANQTSLNGLKVTLQNQDGFTNNHAVMDVRDSDANPDGSVSLVLGAAGENNHSLDFGYRQPLATDLALTKAVSPVQAKPGEQVVYTLTVTNQSTTTEATNVQIADQLPTGVTYVSDDGVTQYGNDVFDEGLGIWAVGSIAVGATKTLNITVQVQ